MSVGGYHVRIPSIRTGVQITSRIASLSRRRPMASTRRWSSHQSSPGLFAPLSSSTTSSPSQSETQGNDEVVLHNILSSMLQGVGQIPTRQLLRILDQPELSQSTLALLFPSITSLLRLNDLDEAKMTLGKILPVMGRNQMLAHLGVIVDLWMSKIDAEFNNGSPTTAVELEEGYHSIIKNFKRFAYTPQESGIFGRDDPLPKAVRQQVTELVAHLIHTLQKLPSSSAQVPHLSKSFLDTLFTRRYLSKELCDDLIQHASQHGVELSARMWNEAALLALSRGEHSSARKLAMEKNKMLELEGGLGSSVVDGSKTEELKEVQNIISQMKLAKAGESLDTLLKSLEPFLYLQDPSRAGGNANDILRDHSWSILISYLSKDRTVTSDDLVELTSNISSTRAVAHPMTAAMYGLMLRGDYAQAWSIWQTLVQKEEAADDETNGGYVDKVALSVAAQICYHIGGVDAAITLVDIWGRRKSHPSQDSSPTESARYSVPLDAQCINVLLTACKREGAASTAFRLWAAAFPRWGVYLDDVSLNLLMDTGRYWYKLNVRSEKEMVGNDIFRERLRELAEGFTFWGRDKLLDDDVEEAGDQNRANDAAGFSKGPTSVLLDIPGSTWQDQWKGRKKPWHAARHVFRRVVLGNWPYLRDIPSPLNEVEDSLFNRFASLFDGRQSQLTHRSFTGRHVLPRFGSHESLPNGPYPHIIPTSDSFHGFISLLGFYHLPHEIPYALAWMKALGLRPTWPTMRQALMHIGECEGPRRSIRGWGPRGEAMLVRDEEVLRRWLEEWLVTAPNLDQADGDRQKVKDMMTKHQELKEMTVPTEDDVADFRRMFLERGQKITA